MSTLIDTLTASGGTESAGFLNDIVAQLWPNICVAGGQIIKDSVEPILATTLPGPLSGLRFTKLDFGTVPFKFSHVDVHKTTTEGIKLDMNVDWEGVCDIELDGNHVPKIGVEKVQLRGRLSILFCPLTNIIPLIGAMQIAFINTPTLNIDFTDAANIADCSLIAKTVRSTILGVISSMFVLPNRFLVKLDANTDYFKAYQPDHGIIRLTIGKATGINPPKKSGASKFLAKIVKDIPDCFVKVDVGAEQWRTSVKKNKYDPEWNETHDFLVTDYEQSISVDVQDDDLVGDDDIGIGHTTIKEVLLNGGTHELALTHNGDPSEVKLTIHAEFYNFIPEASLLTAASGGGAKDSVCGIITILVASALGLQGQRDELNPAIQVTWGDKKFLTAAKTYTPGVDIFNPSFDQAFKIPLTADMLTSPGSFRISLMNKKVETGGAEVPFQDVLSAPGMVKDGSFDMGSGASVRASISVHGVQLAK
ncbi:hypothetical protein N0V83_009131 [Neocucurbitaria cava]|uniref:C2 domain-containing protein n=1 Tax=Neocucurbitaria cava TaxID=798079 RepID=A0A9W8Y250_9PLEO|nr:hypothetical protein N0V83_009131 [Neocucurbitaria cava]